MTALLEHLQSKATHVCRCWSVTRRDGFVFGFTDHDRPLSFDGITFKAESGMTARAMEQVTGLAVDNTQAVGALSDISVTESDINAGRFDGAEVKAWLVNWQEVAVRELQFSGSIGEVKCIDGAFHAELRGLSEGLNQAVGAVFERGCSATTGDAQCGVDLQAPEFSIEATIGLVESNRLLRFAPMVQFEDGWFKGGRCEVMSGEAEGLVGSIKSDEIKDGQRVIGLWEEFRAPLTAGDSVVLEVGCDKCCATCHSKFNNLKNFRGFPHIPGEDWLMGYPSGSTRNDGRSRYR
ncbi:MAG: DUF2163 domain-containing protein [Pseudomonadota bacterium]